jgi:hypothetical protein
MPRADAAGALEKIRAAGRAGVSEAKLRALVGKSKAEAVRQLGEPRHTRPRHYTCPAFQNDEQVREFWARTVKEHLGYDGFTLDINGHGEVLRYRLREEDRK